MSQPVGGFGERQHRKLGSQKAQKTAFQRAIGITLHGWRYADGASCRLVSRFPFEQNR